ncbi:MAG: sugar ABC transporter permease [Pseudomonadota bacterium]
MAAAIEEQGRGGPARPARNRLGLAGRERILAYGLLLPAASVILLLILYPLLRVFELSLREGKSMNLAQLSDLPLGLANYERVLGDPAFWHSVSISALYVGGSVIVAFGIGLVTALCLNNELPFRRALRTLILLPWAVPGVIVSIVFLWILDGSFGVFNAMLRDLGLLDGDQAWFIDQRTALLAVMAPTIWKAYPLITLTVLAALQSIPNELYEAAEIDGASATQRFVNITWPGIKAAAVLATMISALWIFRDIDIIFASTRGGPARATETLAIYVYNEAFQFFRMGTASAVGTMMVGMAFGGVLLAIGLTRRDRFA